MDAQTTLMLEMATVHIRHALEKTDTAAHLTETAVGGLLPAKPDMSLEEAQALLLRTLFFELESIHYQLCALPNASREDVLTYLNL